MGRRAAALDWLKRRWLPAALAVLFAAILLGNRGFRLMVRHTLTLHKINGALRQGKQEEAELRREVALAEKDELALERAARKHLDYRKLGEFEYRFPPPKKSAARSFAGRLKAAFRRMLGSPEEQLDDHAARPRQP
ncbi:MAG: hypothetical protein HY922_01625 [Elusimicrobia bacterium]|nr:hypothetical protein [Elusimicrobiota bacterium]